MADFLKLAEAHRPYGLDCKCGQAINSDADWARHLDEAWTEARTIRTVEQLDALPKRSVIRSSVGDYWERLSRSTWDCLSENGEGPTSPSTGIPLPALVLWTPEAATDA